MLRPLLSALLLAAWLAGAAPAATIHVDAQNPNCPGSGTPADPFCSIQSGILAAAPGDTVLVQPGTYSEDVDFLGKGITVISSGGPALTTISGTGSVVTFATGEGDTSVLEGFTVKGGAGTLVTWYSGTALAGGGVFCQNSSPTIRGNVIEQNSAAWGGGIFCEGGVAVIRDNVIANHMVDGGGGIALRFSAAPLIEGNTIRNNVATASCGGGILALGGSAPVIRENVIEKNRACGGGGIEIESGGALIEGNVIDDNYADDGDGGGIASWASITFIDGNEITDNLAEFDGGGVRFSGGDVTITNNQIQGNRAMPWGNGGGVSGDGQNAVIARNTIASNDTAGLGGGVLLSGSASIRENVIRDNLTRSGVVCTYGAPAIAGNVIAGNKGDGVECLFTGTTPFLCGNTITGNEYGGVFVDQGAAPWIGGSIVYGNGTLPQDEIYLAAGTATVSWSDVRGGFPGTGNIDALPLFVNPAAGDWSLQPGSPCIDKGDPVEFSCGTDLRGTPRRLDGLFTGGERIDMGALEFSHVRLAASVDPLVPSVTIEVTGSAGLPAFLFAGLGRGETCMPPYGSFLLDGALPWILVPWGTVPSSITVNVLPQHLTLEIILQAAALAPAGGAGNTSNAAAIGGA